MARELDDFLQRAEQEEENPLVAAHELFKLPKGITRETLLSAARRKSSRRANLVDIFDVFERFFSELASHLIKIDKIESIESGKVLQLLQDIDSHFSFDFLRAKDADIDIGALLIESADSRTKEKDSIKA